MRREHCGDFSVADALRQKPAIEGRASAALSVLSLERVGRFRLGEAQEAYTWRDGNTLIAVFSGADFYSKIAF
jgi:hypothetical protein